MVHTFVQTETPIHVPLYMGAKYMWHEKKYVSFEGCVPHFKCACALLGAHATMWANAIFDRTNMVLWCAYSVL